MGFRGRSTVGAVRSLLWGAFLLELLINCPERCAPTAHAKPAFSGVHREAQEPLGGCQLVPHRIRTVRVCRHLMLTPCFLLLELISLLLVNLRV